MKPNIKNSYLFRISLITLGALAVLILLFLLIFPERWIPGYLLSLILMAALTGTDHYILRRGLLKTPDRFTQTYMLSTIVKLFIILAFMVIYLLIDRSQAVAFVGVTFLFYLVFTWFEVHALKNEVINGDKREE